VCVCVCVCVCMCVCRAKIRGSENKVKSWWGMWYKCFNVVDKQSKLRHRSTSRVICSQSECNVPPDPWPLQASCRTWRTLWASASSTWATTAAWAPAARRAAAGMPSGWRRRDWATSPPPEPVTSPHGTPGRACARVTVRLGQWGGGGRRREHAVSTPWARREHAVSTPWARREHVNQGGRPLNLFGLSGSSCVSHDHQQS